MFTKSQSKLNSYLQIWSYSDHCHSFPCSELLYFLVGDWPFLYLEKLVVFPTQYPNNLVSCPCLSLKICSGKKYQGKTYLGKGDKNPNIFNKFIFACM